MHRRRSGQEWHGVDPALQRGCPRAAVGDAVAHLAWNGFCWPGEVAGYGLRGGTYRSGREVLGLRWCWNLGIIPRGVLPVFPLSFSYFFLPPLTLFLVSLDGGFWRHL